MALGCEPVDGSDKGRVADPPVPPADAGAVMEAFCQGDSADAGCACYSNTCSRSCGPGECQGLRIVCPHGQDCLVQCQGEGACDGLVLECETGDADCALVCADGACAGARYRCTDVVGNNCCHCEDTSEVFTCPRVTGPDSCDTPS